MIKKCTKHHWIKWKKYPHFGPKLCAGDINFVTSYVKKSDNIEKHKFYPLIYKQARERKYKLCQEPDGTFNRYHSKLNSDGTKESMAKCREIYYASHLDAHILSYYANIVLGPKYESALKAFPDVDKSILAYRKVEKPNGKGKNNIDFAKEVFDSIEEQLENKGACAAVALDVSAFFDSLNHAHLLKALKELLGNADASRLPNHHYAIYKYVTNISFVRYEDALELAGVKHPKDLIPKKGKSNKNELQSFAINHSEFRKKFAKQGKIQLHPFYEKDKPKTKEYRCGIPQGTPISAFLSNLYMLDFDKWACQFVSEIGGLYRRYSDDIVVLCPPEKVAVVTMQFLWQIQECCKLTIKAEKTQVSVLRKKGNNITCQCLTTGKNKPFQYLGFEFNGEVALIRQSSISKFYRRMKTAVRVRCSRLRKLHRQRIPRFSSKQLETVLFKGPIYARYSHLGRRGQNRNYIHYAADAERVFGKGKNKNKIKRQLRNAWPVLEETIQNRYSEAFKVKVRRKIKNSN